MGRMVAQIPNEDPERVKRVLDAKWRTIGVDKSALEQQVDEKRAREQAERDRDAAYAQLSQYFDDQLCVQQQEADGMRRAWNKDTEDFRQANQLKNTRREWDLNRPDAKLMDIPARVGDSDPRCGPSGTQKFDGEDLSIGDRTAAQHEQCRDWWEEQAAQKAAMQAAEKEADLSHAELVKYHDLLQQTSKVQEQDVRREMNKATLDINVKLTEERRLREEAHRKSQLAANMAEMDATISSPFMTEDPNMAASALSTGRVRKDHYKGMTETEKQAILDTQLAQMEELKARREAKRLEELTYARSQFDIMRALDEQGRRVEDFKKQQLDRAAEVLKKQMAEKAERDKDLSTLYKNKIAPEYFLQFGTSHR